MPSRTGSDKQRNAPEAREAVEGIRRGDKAIVGYLGIPGRGAAPGQHVSHSYGPKGPGGKLN